MKTTPSRLLLSHCTTASVNVSQPLSLCELALCALTVNTAFSNNTPDKHSHKMEGMLRTYSSTRFKPLKCVQKYLVWPIQSGLHAQGAGIPQYLRPALCTYSPNQKIQRDATDSSRYKTDHFIIRTLERFCLPGWRWHRFFHTETQTMCLVGTMIRVLAQNHHFDLKIDTSTMTILVHNQPGQFCRSGKLTSLMSHICVQVNT